MLCALSLPVAAQPKKPADPKADKKGEKKGEAKADPKADKGLVKKGGEQNFNFDGIGIQGKNRSPQLLYFLERANEELERASLEKRSFMRHLVRTVDDEAL